MQVLLAEVPSVNVNNNIIYYRATAICLLEKIQIK